MVLIAGFTRRTRLRGRLRLAQALNPWIMPADGYIVSRVPNGLVMELDLNDDLQRRFHYLGDYEALEQRFILDSLPADGVFLDVGANVGWHTLQAARHLRNGQVIAVEPVSWNLQRLRRNLDLNGLRNVSILPVAASDAREETLIRRESTRSGNATLADNGLNAFLETISCAPLDDLPEIRQLRRIDLVKIDVEGAETKALLGMQRTLDRTGRPPILCEINPTLLRLLDSSPFELMEVARTLGYRAFSLEDGPLRPLTLMPGENDHVNAVLKGEPL